MKMLDFIWNLYSQQNVELFCSNYLVIYIRCMLGLKIVDALFDCLVNWKELKYFKTLQVDIPCATLTTNNIPTIKNFRKDGIKRHTLMIVQKVSHAILDCIKLFIGYYNIIWSLSLILAQILYWDVKNEAFVSPLFVFILNIFSFIEDLPFICYRHYFIEKTYKNFSESRKFLLEYIKNVLHSQLLMFPTITIVIALIFVENTYAYLFLIIIAMFFEHFGKIFQLQYLQNNKKQILPRCNLRKQIIKLCHKCAFPLNEIYFVNELKTEYLKPIQFTGYKNKDILIYNTIFFDKTRDRFHVEQKEILAVLAQMIGHWKENHELKLYVLHQIKYFIILILYKIIYKSTSLSVAIGFPMDINPYVCGFIALFRYIMAPFCTIANRLIYTVEQKYIIKADNFAHTLRYGALLRRALIRLNMNYETSTFWDWLNLISYRQQHNLIKRCYNLFVLSEMKTQQQQPIKLNQGLNDLSKPLYKYNVHIGPYPLSIGNAEHICERCFHLLKSEQNCIPHNHIENTGATKKDIKRFLSYENIQYPEVKLKRLSSFNDAKEYRSRKLLNDVKKYRNEGVAHESKYDIESSEGIFQRKPYEYKAQIDYRIYEKTRKDVEADFNLEKHSHKPPIMQQDHNSFILGKDAKYINAEQRSNKTTTMPNERNCFILRKDIEDVNAEKHSNKITTTMPNERNCFSLGKDIEDLNAEKHSHKPPIMQQDHNSFILRKDIEDVNAEKISHKPPIMQQDHNSFILRKDAKYINAEQRSNKITTTMPNERNCFMLGKDIKEVNLDKDIKEVIFGKEIREIKFEKVTKNIKKQKPVTDFKQYVKLENDKPKNNIVIRKNIQVEKTAKDNKTVKMMQDTKLDIPVCTHKETKELKFKRLSREIKDQLNSSSNEQKQPIQMQSRKPKNIMAKESKVINGTIIMAKAIKVGNYVKMAKPNVIEQKIKQEQNQKITQEKHQKITQEKQKITQEKHQKTVKDIKILKMMKDEKENQAVKCIKLMNTPKHFQEIKTNKESAQKQKRQQNTIENLNFRKIPTPITNLKTVTPLFIKSEHKRI